MLPVVAEVAKHAPAHQDVTQESKPKKVRRLPAACAVKMFKPGQSGNPKGRRNGPGLTDLLLMYMPQESDTKGVTWRERIVLATIRLAIKGHPVALKEVWERVDGKVRLDLTVTTEQELWTRLNQGRMRLAQTKTVETRTGLDSQTITTIEHQSIEYDAPAPEEIIEAVAGQVLEQAAIEEEELVGCS